MYTSLLWQRRSARLSVVCLQLQLEASVELRRRWLLLRRSLYCHDIIGQSPRRTPIINSPARPSLYWLPSRERRLVVGVITCAATSMLNLPPLYPRRLSVTACRRHSFYTDASHGDSHHFTFYNFLWFSCDESNSFPKRIICLHK